MARLGLVHDPRFNENSPSFFRGFSKPGYTHLNLLSCLLGSRDDELHSWTYDRVARKLRATGTPDDRIWEETDRRMAKMVHRKLVACVKDGGRDPVKDYLDAEMMSTWCTKPLHERRGTAVFFEIENARAPISYAKDWAVRSPQDPAIVVQVDGHPWWMLPRTAEYGALSHVRPEEISGAYFSYDAATGQAKNKPWRWIHLGVVRDKPGGAPVAIRVSAATEKTTGQRGYLTVFEDIERPTVIRGAQGLGGMVREFMRRYPMLNPNGRKLHTTNGRENRCAARAVAKDAHR